MPLIRLEPVEPNRVIWVAGRASVAQQSGAVRVATAFERQEGEQIALRLEIENLTSEAIEVGPGDVTYAACYRFDGSGCQPPAKVIDPEAALASLQEGRARAEADAANTQVVDATLILLSVAADVAEVTSGQASSRTGLHTTSLASSARIGEVRHGQRLDSISSAQQLWSNVAFRRNTLAPGRGAAGLVFIPAVTKAAFVKLTVVAAGETFPFVFRQTVKRPARPRHFDTD